jgi:hypothetical protein
MRESLPIARLRARLAAQVAAPRVVSTAPRQYYFGEDAAAHAEIDVRGEIGHDDQFVLVVAIGSLPSEDFLVTVWHHHVAEVWLVDPGDEAIYVARRDEPARRFDRGDVVRSPELPGVAIAVDTLFALAS